jgi:hypothetical protein
MISFWCQHGDRTSVHTRHGFGTFNIAKICTNLPCPVDGAGLSVSKMRAFFFYSLVSNACQFPKLISINRCRWEVEVVKESGEQFSRNGRIDGGKYDEILCAGEERWEYLEVRTYSL